MRQFAATKMKYHMRALLVMLLVFTGIIGCTMTADARAKTLIGHAMTNGGGKGVKAGDQSGNEVCFSNFHYTKGGWAGWIYVARAKEASTAKKIAKAIRDACKNDNIGYGTTGTLLEEVAPKVGYDLSKVKTKCNADCMRLVRVCLAAAGINGFYMDFDDPDSFSAFTVYKGSAYRIKGTKLQPGDIVYTRSKRHHHAAIVAYSPNKITGADPKPKATFKKGKRYTALNYMSLYVGPGNDYFEKSVSDISAKGKKLLDNDYFAGISKGTTFTCLDSRRGWIRTAAGWIHAVDSNGKKLVRLKK